jgi:RNA polymerase sigma factor (sigma-70 family)
MPTIEELNLMEDISGITLYSAELRRLPLLTPEEEEQHIAEAKIGNEEARATLLSRCLPWLISKATSIYVEYQPRHSDLMDLVGQANVEMVEALPHALTADNPIRYLMSVGALAMKRYCFYNDPMVRRPRRQSDDYHHPTTVSMEQHEWPLAETLASPDMYLTSEEAEEWKIREQDKLIYNALQQLNPRYRDMLTTYFGLYGQPAKRAGDIAEELHLKKKAVEHVLHRAKHCVATKLAPYMLEQSIDGIHP